MELNITKEDLLVIKLTMKNAAWGYTEICKNSDKFGIEEKGAARRVASQIQRVYEKIKHIY